MAFARVRRFFFKVPTTTLSPAIVADDAPRAKHKKDRKANRAPAKNTTVPCAPPGLVPLEEDDIGQQSTTAEPRDDNQNKGQDDATATRLPGGSVPASVEGSPDKGIPKCDSKKAPAGSGTDENVDSGQSTLPSEHPSIQGRLKRPSIQGPLMRTLLEDLADSDRRRWAAFDGRWKLNDDSSGLAKRFHELFVQQGHVADGKGHVQKLEMKRNRIFWGERPVILSKDNDELIIIDMRGLPVKYVKARSSRSTIADAASSTFVWE